MQKRSTSQLAVLVRATLVVSMLAAGLASYATSAESAVRIALKNDGGIFVVPVVINSALTLDFVIDSGAADVSVPADVVSTLTRTGTLKPTDFTGEKTYIMANGTKVPSRTFIIRSLKVGNQTVENVQGSVSSENGELLLGQSFLKRLKSWSIDNTKHEFVLDAGASSEPAQSSQSEAISSPSEKASAFNQFGEGIEAYQGGDFLTALHAFRPLATRGDAHAQLMIGLMYWDGKGVQKDDDVALFWLRKAADQGLKDAQRVVGIGYELGWNGVQDDGEAFKWLQRAAQQGDAQSQESLGIHYATGHGVTQDYAHAYMWYDIAGSSVVTSEFKAGDRQLAISFRDELAAKMTAAQIDAAQDMALKCRQSNFKQCD